jgi:hypothetical protein
LLDFGCFPGRDLAYFRSLGHEAVGLDGSSRFVEMAGAISGCEVMPQTFLSLSHYLHCPAVQCAPSCLDDSGAAFHFLERQRQQNGVRGGGTFGLKLFQCDSGHRNQKS